MRILHTSDWHIGRSFYGATTVEHLAVTITALAGLVRKHSVDVVVIAGDVFDSAVPAAKAFDFLADALTQLRDAGAALVVSSGNHDSPARLRFPARWASHCQIYISADPTTPVHPVPLRDEYGTVWCYPVPYVEPAIVRHLPGADEVHDQTSAMRWALTRVREDFATRARPKDRTLLLAHCFVAGVPELPGGDDIERDLTAGGIDVVPLSLFDGFDYVALGHIHTRAVLSERVRYCGAPLHYSFSEASAERGAWLVDLDADGFAGATWLELPVPRPLVKIRGELHQLLSDPEYEQFANHWVQATLTDAARPAEAMRRLRERFRYAMHLEYQPPATGTTVPRKKSHEWERMSDEQRLAMFYESVRGTAPSESEQQELHELLAQARESATAQ